MAERPVYDFTKNTNPVFTIWDGRGNDTLDASGFAQNQNINLQPGSYSSIGGLTNNIAVAYLHETNSNAMIENAVGGSGDDTIIGNEKGNDLRGGAGDDTLKGLFGVDFLVGGDDDDKLMGGEGDGGWMLGQPTIGNVLDGGEGSDTAYYNDSWERVVIDLASGQGFGGTADGDTLIRVENIVGSSFRDLILGDGEANWFQGFDGDDIMQGSGGADILDGGNGIDTVWYVDSQAGVGVNLRVGVADGGDAQGDTLVEIENVTGSRFDDLLIGSDVANILQGDWGDDTFRGGDGADEFWGNVGIDTADYSQSNGGVVARLDLNWAGGGGDRAGDKLFAIENLTGSEWRDEIFGDAGDNVLMGLGGGNVMVGGAGADTIDGGEGTDDLLSYVESGDGVTVGLDAGLGEHGDAEGDRLSNIEHLIGSLHSDVLGGNADRNHIEGLDGLDLIFGRGGADTLFGDAGDDALAGEAGDDVLLGGADTDRALFTGNRADYTLSGERTQFTITDTVALRDGTDTVLGVELVQFADGLFSVDDLLVNHAPVVTPADQSLDRNEWDRVNDWFSVSDLNGDAITQYRFWDGGTGANSGYFSTPDNPHHPASTDITVAAADLDEVWFQAGQAGGPETLWVQAFDGELWSDWTSFTVTTPNTAPQVSVSDQSLHRNEWHRVGDWFGVTDADGDAVTQYRFWDSGADAASGYFRTADNPHHAANTNITVDAADLGNVWFQGGQAGGTETLWVQAFDGSDWGEWRSFSLTTDTRIVGTEGDDQLIGDATADIIEGLGGNDMLIGLGGADVLDGGAGTDTADYSASSSGVTVNLADRNRPRW